MKLLQMNRLWLLMLVVLLGCSTSKQSGSNNMAHLYDMDAQQLKPYITVFHQSVDSTILYMRIKATDFLYARKAGTDDFAANILFTHRTYLEERPTSLVDSGTVRIVHLQSHEHAEEDLLIAGALKISLPAGKNYISKVTVVDLNRNLKAEREVKVKKRIINERQQFFLVNSETGIPLFEPIVNQPTRILVQSGVRLDQVEGKYFARNFILPPPPFSTYEHRPFNYDPDSTFVLHPNEDGYFDLLVRKQGFYHLQAVNEGDVGATIFKFPEAFPYVQDYTGMLEPLRYVTSGEEYNRIRNSKHMRKSIEDFWIKTAGSKDKARTSIKKYYTRVTHSNFFYTSYTEGWRTDRGMIYVVYGKPNAVYLTDFGERWVYGEEGNPSSLTFNFTKVVNPFSDNDYRLIRDEIYKPSWYRAVDVWRSGRVINN